jgi:hypothetical protein
MANIENLGNILPGAYSSVVSNSRGTSIGVSTRIAALIGEGSTDEVLVSSAVGKGGDGFNPNYTSNSGSDGRHFLISGAPFISNRITLFKNGKPLIGLESTIDSSSFNSKYDYRVDIATGRVELQKAHLVDQGGLNYSTLSTNVGLGVLNSLTLEDVNAPPETWTIRCVSVQRNVSNQPIAKTAKFLAFGSISGTKLDANGNPVIWVANNNVVSNGVLKFAIAEKEVLSVVTSPFREGDAFTIKVDSGVLNKNDTLVSNSIPASNLNDPTLAQGFGDVVTRYGSPSLNNNLSLGAQLAFSNAAPSIIAVQAAPAMPRRISYILSESVDSTSTNVDDFIFPLPLTTTPDFDSNIHFFITNNATEVETQILPNKLEYYLLDIAGNPTTEDFIMDNTPAPGGFSFFYTVKESLASISFGTDGYIGRDLAYTNKGVFSTSTIFDASFAAKTLKIIDSVNNANVGTYTVDAVVNGDLYVTSTGFTDFVSEDPVSFEVINKATGLALDSSTSGTLVGFIGTATATLSDDPGTGLDFSTISSVTTRRIQINGSTDNTGLYDITAYNSGTNTVTIQKVLVTESNLRYEVLDPNDVSNYIVINKNVVPTGYGLRVTLIDDKDAAFYDPGWVNALASLEPIECDIVVPLPKQTISVIFQNALAHCQAMSGTENRKERILFAGAIAGLTPDNITGAKDAAVENIGILEGIQGESVTDILSGNVEDLANYSVENAFGNTFRCVYFYPDQIVVQAGPDNVLIDGFYMAAAAAGYFARDNRIENPFTNKTLSGFTILRNKLYSQTVLKNLVAAGACVLQPISGGGRVVFGITTTQSGVPEEEEISIVFIRDRIAKLMRAGFAEYIGLPDSLSGDTLAVLNTRAVILLNSFKSQNLITDFAELFVERDPSEPRQFNVSVKVAPTYAINWIYIKIGVGQI